MIDHVSIGVRSIAEATVFYERLLKVIDFEKLVVRETTVGFGKKYPEFWLNARPEMDERSRSTGMHICLRARAKTQVDEAFQTAIEFGARSDGKPGLRQHYGQGYYAAFIEDADGNRIEFVTFLRET